jgi:methyltransferase-like protein/protein-L-isoaspartate O-methyltransferase
MMFDYTQQHSYDEIPYPRLPYAQTHPDRLAAIGTLLGMSPAPVERCRVLELGCAVGGNLTPMAFNLPDSLFVGIDNSAIQIEEAQRDAAALKLDNVRFLHADIRALPSDIGEFDYIIAHGLYSWVPADVRDSIMAICKNHLAPQGIAYISFNTYPGWHMMRMVREMMLYHIRDIRDPRERAIEGQQFIKFLVGAIPKSHQSAYSDYLANYNRFREESADSSNARYETSILHDELAGINEPFYFYQFAEHAARHQLQYLAESNLSTVMQGNFSDETADYLRNLTDDVVAREQYGDFLRNRTFRSTLLCHADIAVDRTLRPDRMQHFRFVSQAKPLETDSNPRGIRKFRSLDGAIFSTNHPISIAAFEYLSEIAPLSVSFAQLFSSACRRLGIQTPGDQDAYILAANLLQAFCYSMELIELRMHQPRLTTTLSERPLASQIARYQAATDVLVANQRHERAELGGLSGVIIGYLDGEHDRQQILDKLVEMVTTGQIQLQVDGESMDNQQVTRQLLSEELDSSLRWLAYSALLID